MKTIQLVRRLDPIVTGQDEEGKDIIETPVEVVEKKGFRYEEDVEEEHWPNATRRFRLQAEKFNTDEATDIYSMREKPKA